MPYAKLNASGCGIHKNRGKLRLDFFLSPTDPHYDKHHVYVPDETSEEWQAGYQGELTEDGSPQDPVAYQAWLATVPHIWRDNPFHCHFIYPEKLATDFDIKATILQCFNYFYNFHQYCWDNSKEFIEEWKKVPRQDGTVRCRFVAGNVADRATYEARIADIVSRAGQFAIGAIGSPPPDLNIGEKGTIDIGSAAIDRANNWGFSMTNVTQDNPANDTGIIDTIELWAFSNLSDMDVATFYMDGNDATTIDYEELGSVTSGSKQTFSSLDMDVNTGNYIGFKYSAGALEVTFSGEKYWYITGDYIPCTDQTFSVSSSVRRTWSIYGTGTTGGVVEQLAAIIVAGSSASATAIANRALASTVDGIATVVGAIVRTRPLASIINGIATVTGTLTTGAEELLQAAITASASAAGAIIRDLGLSGTIDGIASVTGTLTRHRPLASVINGIATVTGALEKYVPLAGTILSSSTATGALTFVRGLASTILSSAVATANLVRNRPLASTITTSSVASALLGVVRPLQATVNGIATVTGTLTTGAIQLLSAAITGIATVANSVLNVKKTLTYYTPTIDEDQNDSDVTLSKPSGTAEGDLLFAHICLRDDTDTPGIQTPYPSNFQLLEHQSNISCHIHHYLFYKVATASEPSSYQFVLDFSTYRVVGAMYRFTGNAYNPSDPIDDSGSAQYITSDDYIDYDELDVTEEDSALLAFGGFYSASSINFTVEPDDPTDDWVENYDSYKSYGDHAIAQYSMIWWADNGNTGDAWGRLSTDVSCKVGFMVALNPPSILDIYLQAAVTAIATVTGAITRNISLSSAVNAIATATGTLITVGDVFLNAVVNGVATATASLSRMKWLSGAVTGIATTAGTLTKVGFEWLAATISSSATAVADLSISGIKDLVAAITSSASTVGAMVRDRGLASSILSSAVASASLGITVFLNAAVTATATVVGNLIVGILGLLTKLKLLFKSYHDIKIYTQTYHDVKVFTQTYHDVKIWTGDKDMIRRDWERGETVPVWMEVTLVSSGALYDPDYVYLWLYDKDGTVVVDGEEVTTNPSTGLYVYYWNSPLDAVLGEYRGKGKTQDGSGDLAKITIENGGFILHE